jgi:predicted component of viral defense system (DUF524 family)
VTEPARKVNWAGYELTAVGNAPLIESGNGDILISSEGRYLLQCQPPARLPGWRSVQRLREGTGVMQFVNFIGIAELGGKRIHVKSNRLDSDEVANMLSDVVARLTALLYTRDSPTGFGYTRTATAPDDVLLHAYVYIRHALRGIGPHDVRPAMDRVLMRPHRRLTAVKGDKPLAETDRFDTTSATSIFTAPLEVVPPSSRLSRTPLALALDGRIPTRIRTQRLIETTNTRENAFVANVWRLSADLVRAYAGTVARRDDVGSAETVREAQELSDIIGRWQRHPVLATTTARRSTSIESSVLRGRPGYRDVTRFFVDLQSRTRLLEREDAERLLEARDAALIYEYWCFFRVVEAVGVITGADPRVRYKFTPFTATVGQGQANGVTLGDCTVWFNRQFEKRSYSVPLRPDISVELKDGSLHLFDAKFKHDPADWQGPDDGDADTARTYRRGDLYKMHTYRDALDAESAWILYPGRGVGIFEYPTHDASARFAGVGAIPLTPGIDHQQANLRDKIAELVAL